MEILVLVLIGLVMLYLAATACGMLAAVAIGSREGVPGPFLAYAGALGVLALSGIVFLAWVVAHFGLLG